MLFVPTKVIIFLHISKQKGVFYIIYILKGVEISLFSLLCREKAVILHTL